MPDSSLSNSRIIAAYRERTAGSAALIETARQVFPSGLTHDSRYVEPYGIYVERAAGPRKWDVDGNEYVDYFGGHGSLILGHNNPAVTAAVQAALANGTHFGASHPLEVRWAELVRKLVPSAGKVRFTSSGTEATLMALRLARAFTGQARILRVRTHFHGWQDHMAMGTTSHFDGSATVGVLDGIAAQVVLVDPEDIEGMRAALAGNDIAAAILEPTGSSTGMVPTSRGYLEALREATRAAGTVLIFDEVVTGFRVSPGGAQARYDIIPDMTTLAKILAGGLPGGAVVGPEEIMQQLDFQAMAAQGKEKIGHQGTYNANPVSAAAGVTALGLIDTTDACDVANATGDELRGRLNDLFASEGVPWAAYGTFSAFHIFTNPQQRTIDPHAFDPFDIPFSELKSNAPGAVQKLRLAMLVNGVDLSGWPGGTISATHGAAEIDHTMTAFKASIAMMKADGDL
jgi:glutamate-1-semialdehyde 2,1-aminomutase